MKTIGLIMIIAGIAMIIIKGFNITTEKNVVDVGPLQINKTENKWIGWPTYAGAVIAALGVVVIIADKRKSV